MQKDIEINNIKNIVISAINEAEQHEVKIVQEDWGVEWNFEAKKWVFEDPYNKTACALGAVLLKHQPEPKENNCNPDATIAQFLGVDNVFVMDFISGFDDGSYGNTSKANCLGAEVGEEAGFVYNNHNDDDDDF